MLDHVDTNACVELSDHVDTDAHVEVFDDTMLLEHGTIDDHYASGVDGFPLRPSNLTLLIGYHDHIVFNCGRKSHK